MDFFNRLSQRDQILVVTGAIVLMVVLVAFLVIFPQFGKIKSLSEKQKTLEQGLEEAKLNLARLKSIKSEAAQTEAKLIALARRLPQDAELPAMVVELQNVANSAGLEFSSAKLDNVVDKSGFAEIPLTINAQGTFYSVIDFIYRVENLPRKLVINEITVTSKDESYPDLEVEIKLNAYKLSTQQPTLPPPPGAANQQNNNQGTAPQGAPAGGQGGQPKQ